jgi:quinol-cytochrome oxidoreductase complex cytochrome b subunit
MIFSLVILFLLPYILKGLIIRSGTFRPWHAISFWILVVTCLQLSWIGGLPVLSPYLELSQWYVILYFLIFIVLFPAGIFIDKLVYHGLIYRKEFLGLLYF